MSVDYYMACPQCKRYAQIFRVTAGGYNPPNSFKVHAFFFAHSSHDGFACAAHEGDPIMDRAEDEEWVCDDTWGEGREAKPATGDES